MNKPRIYVDFNEMVESDLVLLSKEDSKTDFSGNEIILYEGLQILMCMDDLNEDGSQDNLVASGVVEKNNAKEWSANVKWCCRINESGIRHESELEKV